MVVKILVAHGANLDLQNVVGNTALHVAVSHGYSAVIEHLIRNGADVNLLNKRNLRPVQMTTASTTIELVNYLTQRQVSIAMSRLRQLQASKDQMENELSELKNDHESLKQVVIEKDIVIETLKKQQEEMQKQIQTIMSLLKPEIV
jgi:ankyrin repeat protein